jgi:hypothetical protein
VLRVVSKDDGLVVRSEGSRGRGIEGSVVFICAVCLLGELCKQTKRIVSHFARLCFWFAFWWLLSCSAELS